MLDNECKCGRGLVINEQIRLCKECFNEKMGKDINDLMDAEGRIFSQLNTTNNSVLLPVDIAKDVV